ncbi:hypothetical protein JTB14_030139 [Gonioctena quinquepunctata]|nr:hypothetical protein JTB14_030139 [Gonioctena quinquepunctata]
MNRRPLNEAELGRFGENDSEDGVPDNFREEDRDLSDAPSEHSDHESESEIELALTQKWNESQMMQEWNKSQMMQKWNKSQMKQEWNESKSQVLATKRYKWSKNLPAPSRIRRSDIIHLPGTRGAALATKPKTPSEA